MRSVMESLVDVGILESGRGLRPVPSETLRLRLKLGKVTVGFCHITFVY